MHSLNIIRQVLLESRVEIDELYYEPALMLAMEAITSHVYSAPLEVEV